MERGRVRLSVTRGRTVSLGRFPEMPTRIRGSFGPDEARLVGEHDGLHAIS